MLAARKLGLATVPVIELAHLSEAQKRAYVLADNKLAEAGGLGQGPAGAGTGRSARHGGGPGKPRLRGRGDWMRC
ncbi:MAG: hypothetical protein V9E89_19390 [Ilumatobacteraceae bacterium]